MKRAAILLLALIVLLGVLGFTAPGPLQGVWQLQILQCACPALTVAEFEDGSVTIYSERTESYGPKGSYRKSEEGWIWDPRGEAHEWLIQPRWFTLKMTELATGDTYTGKRVIWPPTRAYARTLRAAPSEQTTTSKPP